MKSLLLRAALLLLSTSWTACSVEAESVTPGSYPDYVKLLYQQTCEARLRCCSTLCSDLNDSSFYRLTNRLQSYIGNGYMLFDPQAAKECLESQRKRVESCDAPVPSTLPGCDRVLLPRSPVGGPCESSIPACTADGFCSGNRCLPLLKVGQTCNVGSSQGCTSGSYCQLQTTTSTYVCTLYPAQGQSCATYGRCDSQQGMVCLPSALCGPPLPLDSVCNGNGHCASGYCDSVSLTCKQTPLPITVRQQLCAQTEPIPPQ